MLNVAVWPYSTGEVILQNYNSLLTISRLILNSDGVISIYNDEMLNLCKRGKMIKNPTFDDLNQSIAEHLMSVFRPCANTSEKYPRL